MPKDQLNRNEQIAALEAALTESIDGADSPHQEIINKGRYERINKQLRSVLEALRHAKQERTEIEGMKDADYVQVYVNRSERTQPNPADAVLMVDSRTMSLLQGALGVSKEAGTIAELMHDRLFNGTTIGVERMRDQLGNMAWFLAILLREFGISLEEVLLENLAKLDRKFPEANVLSAGDPDEEI